MRRNKNQAGLSLLELIVVLGIAVVLGTALFFWIDPVEQVGKAEDKRRQQDVLNIAKAFADYARDHKGALPILGQVNTAKKVLCTTQSGSTLACGASTEYCLKIDDQEFFDKYLGKLPLDPDKTSDTDTGYYLLRDANNNLTFGACDYSVAEVTYKPALQATCDVYAGGYCWYSVENWNANCNTICSANNKACVANATYGPDTLCLLNDLLNAPYGCTTDCGPSTAGEPPFWSDDDSCGYAAAVFSCSQTSGFIPICPCQ